MISCCLVQVSFSGTGKDNVLELFFSMGKQDYKKPRYSVGMFPKNKELENEFGLVKTYWGIHMVRYFTDLQPNVETLKLIGKLYNVSFDLQYEFLDNMGFGSGYYDCDTNELEVMNFYDSDFYGYTFKNGYYFFEKQRFSSKYFLRRYCFDREQRNKRLEFILNTFE